MAKKVWIKVRGTQTSPPGEDGGEVELITEGTYSFRNGTHFLAYDESEATGMAGTRTTIRVGENGVIVHRTGAINTEMQFEPGSVSHASYDTGFGVINMNTYTNKVFVDIDAAKGGDISVEYRVEMDNRHGFDNRFSIAFKFGKPAEMLREKLN